MTFLVILLTSLYEPITEQDKRRCLIHPAKKQFMLYNAVTDYAADMNILLTHDHFRDDWEDERKLKGFLGMKLHIQTYTNSASHVFLINSNRHFGQVIAIFPRPFGTRII